MPAISQLRRSGDDHCADFLKDLVDNLGRSIQDRSISIDEARESAAALRFQASLLFPGRMETYDRIYGARFERLIEQFLVRETPCPAVSSTPVAASSKRSSTP